MRILSTIAAALLVISYSLSAAAQRAALFDELAVLYPDSDAGSGVEKFTSDTPRGVPAGVHVLISGLPVGDAVHWEIGLRNLAAEDADAYRLIDVPVEQNTGLVNRTELWDGKENPHVIRDAPFRIFEALEPADRTVRVSDNGVLAMRVEVPIAPDAETGLRSYKLTFETDSWRQALHWELRVYPITVPLASPLSPGYTNWFSPAIIAQRHGLDLWSEPFWQMLGRYADLMARGRQNTFLIRWGDFIRVDKDGKLALDRPRLTRYVQLFLARGFTRLEGGHLAHRHKGDWDSPRPWLNRLLDQERLRPTYLGWALAKYDLQGFLHWGFNHYRSGTDPFVQSVVPHGKGPPNFLPAGDSHVVFPGKDGPLSGHRFEAQRIGMEDAELLYVLKARDADRAEQVIARAFRAFDSYEKDVGAYRAAKRELLTALSPSGQVSPENR